ncbi:MAG: hypothetical protein P8J50_02330 [Acidimicrobiales bacterium]|nr:hypothetical protein [Acidimicrobiales bacterium]
MADSPIDPSDPGPRSFRKKPVIVEAMLWDGSPESADAVLAWIHAGAPDDEKLAEYTDPRDSGAEFATHTLEGRLTASPGDWIIRGVVGEFYACKPEVFADTYESA